MKKKMLLTFMLSAGWALWPEAQAQVFVAAHNPAMVNHTSQTKQVSLKTALSEIEAKYKVSIAYQTKAVANRETVLPDQDFATVEEALQVTLKNHDLQFKKVKDRAYIVMPIPASKEKSGPQSQSDASDNRQAPVPVESLNANEISVANLGTTAAPEVTIAGKVSGPNGDALPGVTVLLKGTTIGATTGPDGSFSLRAPEATGTLVFSFIGFVTKEVPVNGRTTVNVSLAEDTKTLNEVVVVGYGTQIKKNVASSISSIKADDLKNTTASQVDALIQGKAAGVQVVQSTGTPGGEVFVRVRGTASLRSDSRPLYVIDGVPMNNISGTILDAGGQRASALADINPNDIESMDILKDASATAIYGARGANGVILITTKRGKEGKAKVEFDAFYGLQENRKTFDLLDGAGFSEVLRDAITHRNSLSSSGQVNLNSPAYVSALTVTGNNTNYQDEIFRVAPMSTYNISVSGGQDKIRTFASLGMYNQQGTIIGQDYKRINGRFNLDYQATGKLKIGNSITYSNAQSAKVINDFSSVSVLANALLRNPNLAVRDETGTYVNDPLGRNGTENPVQLANDITFNENQRRLIANVYGEFALIKNLTIRSDFGLDNLGIRVERYVPSFIQIQQGISRAQAANSDSYTLVNDNTLRYNQDFGQHRINAVIGLGLQHNRSNYLQAGGNTSGSDIITTLAISNPDVPSHNISEWALKSYFGRVNYGFKDRYIIEGSFRTDGSSRFGENKRFGIFPAASIAWRAIEEDFMKGLSFVSDLKVRAGIGTVGNQEGLDNFGSLTIYNTGRNYDGLPGIAQSNVPNPDLSWESTTTTNGGIEVSFFNSRITFIADAYNKKTSQLLFTRQLPWTSGFSEIPNVNVGKMENKGLELALSTQNLTGDFKWTTDFNIAFNRNKITDLPVNGSSGSDFIFKMPDAYAVEGPYSIYRVGEPIGSFYGYKFEGVYARDEDVPANLRDNNPLNSFKGGYPRVADINNDGVYDRINDRVIIGNALPLHTGGFTNNFSYKGLSLNVFMTWSYGNDIYNMTRAVLTTMTDDFNQSTEVNNRWKQQGDVTNIPRALYLNNSIRGLSFTDASSRFIEDGSFLRVRNVTLGYSLPTSLVSKAKLSSARINITGQNLLVFTNYTGLDPENQNTGGGGTPTLGVDYLTQPQPRIYSLGINLGF